MPTIKPPVTVAERQLADLEALRAALVAALGGAEGTLPAVSKELRAVNAEIAALSKGAEVSGVDDLRARRESRRAAAPDSARASGRGGKQRRRSS